jgi:hypothetical protein
LRVISTRPLRVISTRPSRVISTRPSRVISTRHSRVISTRHSRVISTRPSCVMSTRPLHIICVSLRAFDLRPLASLARAFCVSLAAPCSILPTPLWPCVRFFFGVTLLTSSFGRASFFFSPFLFFFELQRLSTFVYTCWFYIFFPADVVVCIYMSWYPRTVLRWVFTVRSSYFFLRISFVPISPLSLLLALVVKPQ